MGKSERYTFRFAQEGDMASRFSAALGHLERVTGLPRHHIMQEVIQAGLLEKARRVDLVAADETQVTSTVRAALFVQS